MNTRSSDSIALWEALKGVFDPEFGVNVVDMGIVYRAEVAEGVATVVMTLASMYCPAGDVILAEVKAAAERVPGVVSADVQLVWEPIWTPDLLSTAARKQLGWDEPRVTE